MKHGDARAWSGCEAASYLCPERRTPPGLDPPFFSRLKIVCGNLGTESGVGTLLGLDGGAGFSRRGGLNIVFEYQRYVT
jgi:hypothetical protein